MREPWDASRLMAVAITAAANSPDPSTQNGAVLALPDWHPLKATAVCNEFPAGIQYLAERWERPTKYDFIEHAERNAIYAAARGGIETDGLTLVVPWAACADCARAIVQAGIARVVRLKIASDLDGSAVRWKDSVNVGDVIMAEGGVEIVEISLADTDDLPTLRRNGEPWRPC